ncbi:MAG: hypothetical protein ACLPUG_11130 [Acidimicrobiales bacterium]
MPRLAEFHLLQQADVRRAGDLLAEKRPEVLVLGPVVDVELRFEVLPTGVNRFERLGTALSSAARIRRSRSRQKPSWAAYMPDTSN